MEEFKKWFDKEKIKYPYRPINEIDCGMGYKAAFENMENWIRGRRCTGEDMLEYIYKELGRNY